MVTKAEACRRAQRRINGVRVSATMSGAASVAPQMVVAVKKHVLLAALAGGSAIAVDHNFRSLKDQEVGSGIRLAMAL